MAEYQHGEYYAAHSDFTMETGYDRVATFLIYLSTVDDGGETVRSIPALSTFNATLLCRMQQPRIRPINTGEVLVQGS